MQNAMQLGVCPKGVFVRPRPVYYAHYPLPVAIARAPTPLAAVSCGPPTIICAAVGSSTASQVSAHKDLHQQ
jgi:hypothetical protein